MSLNDTDQLYNSVAYLPHDEDKSPPTDDPCVAGAVILPSSPSSDPKAIQVLPGMAIRVAQTSYRRNDHFAVPLASQWQWRIPSSIKCPSGGGGVPTWSREDMVTVRHLLSAAQVEQPAHVSNEGNIDLEPEYFQQAIASCPEHDLTCVETKFLDRFVEGLYLNVRAHAQPKPNGVPEQVLSGSAQNHFAQWFSGLFKLRQGDVDFASMAPDCATRKLDLLGGSEPCNFSLVALQWKPTGEPLPGELLGRVRQLDVIRSGPPIPAFRPQSYGLPFDPADTGIHCVKGQSQDCTLTTSIPCPPPDNLCSRRDRMAQGFVELQLLIPVWKRVANIPGQRDLLYVPVGTTVADFAEQYGRVERISRPTAWFPEEIATRDGPVDRSKLGGKRRRIALHFVNSGGAGGLGGGLTVRRTDAGNILMAPGDDVVVRNR